MCSFITQHNATDVARFEGVWSWLAVSRNVHQSCWMWIEWSFTTLSCLWCSFQELEYIQPASQPHTTCNLPAQHIYIQLPHLLDHLRPATWKAYAKLKKLSESISGGSSVCLSSLFSLYRVHCRQCVFADISVLNGVPHGGSGFMYGQAEIHTANTSAFYWCQFECTMHWDTVRIP